MGKAFIGTEPLIGFITLNFKTEVQKVNKGKNCAEVLERKVQFFLLLIFVYSVLWRVLSGQ